MSQLIEKSRITSEPVFNLSLDKYFDEATSQPGAFFILSVCYTEGFSGSITLNDFDDILTLRRELDTFIKREAPKMGVILDNEPVDEPLYVTAVKGWLAGLKPAQEYVEGETFIVTGADIVNALADTYEVELNEVARAMNDLGYKTWRVNQRYGWLVNGNPF